MTQCRHISIRAWFQKSSPKGVSSDENNKCAFLRVRCRHPGRKYKYSCHAGSAFTSLGCCLFDYARCRGDWYSFVESESPACSLILLVVFVARFLSSWGQCENEQIVRWRVTLSAVSQRRHFFTLDSGYASYLLHCSLGRSNIISLLVAFIRRPSICWSSWSTRQLRQGGAFDPAH